MNYRIYSKYSSLEFSLEFSKYLEVSNYQYKAKRIQQHEQKTKTDYDATIWN